MLWDPARDGLTPEHVARLEALGQTCLTCRWSRPLTTARVTCLRYRDAPTPYHAREQRECHPTSSCLGWTSPHERHTYDPHDPEEEARYRAEETAAWPDLTRAPT